MGREILTTVRVEKSPDRTEYGVRMTTTSVDTGNRNGHPISPIIKDEPSIFTMQTNLSRKRRRLLLMQAGSLSLAGVTSSVAAGEAVTIFNRGDIDFTESVSKTAAGIILTVALAKLTARLNGRRNIVNIQSEAAEMARRRPDEVAKVEKRRKKRLIGFKNIKTRTTVNPIKEAA